MMHHRRIFDVADVERSSLAKRLVDQTWTVCSGFRCVIDGRRLLFLNDSTGPDGAQEYAVWDEATGNQIESFTVSWMSPEEFDAAVADLVRATRSISQASLPSLAHAGPCRHCR